MQFERYNVLFFDSIMPQVKAMTNPQSQVLEYHRGDRFYLHAAQSAAIILKNRGRIKSIKFIYEYYQADKAKKWAFLLCVEAN